MKRYIPGLHTRGAKGQSDEMLEGAFLVRLDRAFYRWHPQRPFYLLRFVILEPCEKQGQSFGGRLYCTSRAMWKFDWILRDFRYDTDLLGRDEVDDRALIGLRGIVRISHTVLNGHNYLNLSGFAPAEDWDETGASDRGGEEART
jgi:hypothetical protein